MPTSDPREKEEESSLYCAPKTKLLLGTVAWRTLRERLLLIRTLGSERTAVSLKLPLKGETLGM